MQSEELLHPPYNWSRHEDWTLWVTSSLHHGQSLALLLADLSNQIARQADTDCVTTPAALQLHLGIVGYSRNKLIRPLWSTATDYHRLA